MARSRKIAADPASTGRQFVAYYRVSTARQGESELGLEAQRAAVARYLAQAGAGAALAAEFTEVESGKRHTNRPQLAKAIEQAKRGAATLIIAKLDRLARNVHFISGLMESAADFVACDMPHANRLTIHILAAIAEHEREMISARTVAALEQVKARGTRLGNPRWQESIAKARGAPESADSGRGAQPSTRLPAAEFEPAGDRRPAQRAGHQNRHGRRLVRQQRADGAAASPRIYFGIRR